MCFSFLELADHVYRQLSCGGASFLRSIPEHIISFHKLPPRRVSTETPKLMKSAPFSGYKERQGVMYNTLPPVLPLLGLFPPRLLPLHIVPARSLILGQLFHERGSQLLNSGVVGE